MAQYRDVDRSTTDPGIAYAWAHAQGGASNSHHSPGDSTKLQHPAGSHTTDGHVAYAPPPQVAASSGAAFAPSPWAPLQPTFGGGRADRAGWRDVRGNGGTAAPDPRMLPSPNPSAAAAGTRPGSSSSLGGSFPAASPTDPYGSTHGASPAGLSSGGGGSYHTSSSLVPTTGNGGAYAMPHSASHSSLSGPGGVGGVEGGGAPPPYPYNGMQVAGGPLGAGGRPMRLFGGMAPAVAVSMPALPMLGRSMQRAVSLQGAMPMQQAMQPGLQLVSMSGSGRTFVMQQVR